MRIVFLVLFAAAIPATIRAQSLWGGSLRARRPHMAPRISPRSCT